MSFKSAVIWRKARNEVADLYILTLPLRIEVV